MTKAEIQQVKLRFGIIGNNEALMRAIDIAAFYAGDHKAALEQIFKDREHHTHRSSDFWDRRRVCQQSNGL